MPKSTARTYSTYTRQATAQLGGLVRQARQRRKLTVQEVADRAGISRGLMQRIEKGDLKCEIGAFFEVATIVGVTLFEADDTSLKQHLNRNRETLSLLPKSVRKSGRPVKDDF